MTKFTVMYVYGVTVGQISMAFLRDSDFGVRVLWLLAVLAIGAMGNLLIQGGPR